MKIFIAVTAGPAIFQQGIADTPGRLAQSVFHGFFHHIIRIWALLFVVKACQLVVQLFHLLWRYRLVSLDQYISKVAAAINIQFSDQQYSPKRSSFNGPRANHKAKGHGWRHSAGGLPPENDNL